MKQHKPKSQSPKNIYFSNKFSQSLHLQRFVHIFCSIFQQLGFSNPIQTLQSILMSQSKIINLFKESTQMYCQGNYSACLALLSDCLTLQSDRSILYSNRAIANYHLKQLQNSFEDLQKAIKTNHLNYIAYFNLFSLHFLNGNCAQALKNLYLCLSSAYTILCRMEPSQEFLGQSLYYSCNNKQSLFLLGVLKYEKSQLRASLQLFKQSLQLEIHQKYREGIIRHINSVVEQLGESKISYQALPPSSDFYTLQTSLACPSQEVFEERLTKLLKEFNEVYRLINDQMQMEHQFKENTASKISREKISNIEDKDVNRGTTYNSTAYSRAIEPEDQRSTMMLMSHHRELKLLSVIADDQKLGLEANTEPEDHENCLYPLKKNYQKVKFFIDSAQLNVSIDEEKEKIDSLYAILRYKENGKTFEHRTSILQNNENIKWCEWTDEISLPSKETDLEIKILNKKYTAFKDDLLAQGRIPINKAGLLSIPLFHNQQCNGSILLTVETQ